MVRVILILLVAAPLAGQTAGRMLALLNGVQWEPGPTAKCTAHTPVQMDIYATVQWTHHWPRRAMASSANPSSTFFAEPGREARLRVDLRPVDESPATRAATLGELRRLTARFGAPTPAAERMEIGYRKLRYAEPVAGDHWKGAGLHYYLHANQSNADPMGMRRAVQLIVIADRLAAEREKDALILGVEKNDPVRSRLQIRIGEPSRPMQGMPRTPAERAAFLRASLQDLATLLRESDHAGRPRRALYLLAAHEVTNKLSQMMEDPGPLRRLVSSYAASSTTMIGGPTHNGGLDYRGDLLWRVWREPPETEAGELAFLALERRAWDTSTGEGCPANPDQFREVIGRGEAFLSATSANGFRRGNHVYAGSGQ